MGLDERAADLGEDVHDALGGLGPMLLHEVLERDSVQVLHRVVEDVVRRAAVIEDRDGVGMREACRDLHLALETLDGRARAAAQQLDRRGTAQQRVARAVDDAHAALADLLLEEVLAELHGLPYLEAEAVDDIGDRRRARDAHAHPDRDVDRGTDSAEGIVGRAANRVRHRQERQHRPESHEEAPRRSARNERRPRGERVARREEGNELEARRLGGGAALGKGHERPADA